MLRHHLAQIAAFEPIQKSPRMGGLLNYLFEETLAGRSAAITQCSIAADCYQLDSFRDGREDNLVRVHASRLRRAIKAYYAGPGARDEVRLLLASGSYAFRFEGQSAAALGLIVEGERPVVALIEFKSLALDGYWQHLPAVLGEELGAIMGREDRIQVIGPFLRQRLEAEGLDPVELGMRHQVDFILDGSVQRRSQTLVLRTRLIDGKSGRLIWGGKEVWDADQPDLVGFEEKLMHRLSSLVGEDCGVISQHLSSLARVKSEHALTVFESVLLGRMYLTDFHYESLPRVLETLRRAVRQVPLESAPHATLAVILASLGHEPRWQGDPPLAEIRELAGHTMRLNPRDPWSILAGCFSATVHRERDELARIGALLESVAGHAPSMLLGGVGVLLCYQKMDLEKGVGLIEQACATNPHYPSVLHLALALVFFDVGDFEAARRELDALQFHGGLSEPLLRAAMAALEDDFETARREWQSVLAAFPTFSQDGARSLGFLWHRDYITQIAAAMQRAGIHIELTE